MAGRGVDILLGGNPEGLARRECMREGIDARHARVRRPLRRAAARASRTSARPRATRSASSAASTCSAPSATRSRRIDNQLRGRSGRQGDPGESRFYLSLEDELMRLFATGAHERVMGKSFPDDVPLESKMVIEGGRARAGHGRRPQLRDPQGRPQVRRGDERAAQGHLPAPPADPRRRGPPRRRARGDRVARSAALVDQYCGGEFVGGVGHRRAPRQTHARTSRRASPRSSSTTCRRRAGDRRAARSTTRSSCTRRRKQSIGAETLRDIERRVMLSVIDQHWREHLYEMDYLQEGINLRAMGQQDPLAEWQREGFDMFEAMMGQIEDDFVRYVFHLQVVVDEEPPSPTIRNVQYSAPSDPVQGSSVDRGARWPPRPADERRWRSTTAEAADGAADRAGRSSSRCGSRRRPGATSRASAGAARSTSSATGVDCTPCATSPRTWLICARRVDDAHALPAASTTRASRLAELEAEVERARPLGRPGPRRAR